MTEAEQKLWSNLRCEQFAGLKFRRQAAIGRYIVDFVCFSKKLIVEVDGGQHNEHQQHLYDEERTNFLESQGFQVLRFWNYEVLEDLDCVLDSIEKALSERESHMPPSPSPSPQGGGG